MSVEQDPITDEDQIKHLKETKQFWKLKSNVGRKKLFETPELLLKAANEYFTWIDENPLEEETLYHHAGVIRKVMKAKKRPYTVRGLCLYLRVAPNYLRSFKGGIKDKAEVGKKTELDEDFLTIISYIEETCYSQKFEGAAADFFNSNIIARDLGLVDKKQLDVPKTIKYKNVSKEYPKEKP